MSEKESSRLYWELSQRGGFCTGSRRSWKYGRPSPEELLTLSLLQARYDPRLMAILIDLFRRQKRPLHPLRFQELLEEHGALAIASVVGEFVVGSPTSRRTKELFRYLMSGSQAVPTQLFYRGLYRIGGKKAEEVIRRPLWPFKKWGFLAADPPILKESPTYPFYLFDRPARINILRDLAEKRRSFSLRDYRSAVFFSVSRQQALKDLSEVFWIRKNGSRKGTVYELVR